MDKQLIIDVGSLFNHTEEEPSARLKNLKSYISTALTLAGEGNDIILTGAGPVWLYLKIAHALHGKARKLIYRSPVTGDIIIFDHSP